MLTVTNNPILAPPANMVLQSIFLIASRHPEPNSLSVSNTLEAPSVIPLIKPSTTFVPTSYIFVDGECIPSTPFIASSIDSPISISI